MAKALLIVPHFWDPVCVPLGISSLKAYAEKYGHHVDLFDFNTLPEIFKMQRNYFEEGKLQFPYWNKWNIERNGTEMLAIHQIVYLYARHLANYRELTAEVLNMNNRPIGEFMGDLNIQRFDEIFDLLYKRVAVVLEKIISKYKPDVVGCTLNNSTWPGTLFILKYVKELMPHVRTVVGGPGPILGITSNRDEVIKFLNSHDFIDYFVIGEGEQSFLEILDNPELPRGILGLTELPLTEIKKNAIRMNDLPLPDYGDLNINRYLQLSVSSSRGCPFECSFCAETVFWRGFRSLDKSMIFKAISILAKRYNRTSFYLCDSLSNHIISHLAADISASGKPYTIDCYLRADRSCTDETGSKRWRHGGLFRARLGMESASQRILDAMVKKTTPENMAKSLHALATQGILTCTLWIVCYPGETEAEFESTLTFIRENHSNIYQADAWLFQYHPTGLSNSSKIDSEKGSRLRFSNDINEILAINPYLVDNDISLTERFNRLERFTAEMESLRIPNPYSIHEMINAQDRWSKLGHDSGWDPFRSLTSITA